MTIENYRNLIKKEYEARKQINPNFSMRAYAKWLGISPAQASQLISGKRNLTRKMGKKISERLGLSPRERIEFLESIHPEVVEDLKQLRSEEHKTQLAEDQFNLIADWPHFSILSLSEIKGCKSDPRWIAKKLGIDVKTAADCFERLLRLKLIERKGASFSQCEQPLTTSKDIVSKAIQRHHKQNLDLAQHKIEQVDPKLREYSSITMAIDPKKIKQAKLLINDFKRKLCSILEDGEKKEVYTLSIQLFPNSILPEESNNE